MHDLGTGWAAIADRSQSRSSVASKRFPLSNERLARFRFARDFFRATRPMGRVVPNEFAKPITVSREQG
jgi:hypothetical protein